MMNKWLNHNLQERLTNRSSDFKAWVTPTPFSIMEFHAAADYTVNEIIKLNKNIFLSLSGGVDSEYALLSFYRNKIPVIPIIIKTHFNDIEVEYAYHICKKLNIKYHHHVMDENDYLNFYSACYKKINARFWYSIPNIIASKIAKENNGLLVIGNEMTDYNFKSVWKVMCAEWDFYQDVILPDNIHIDFFNHTPELAYKLIYEYDGSPVDELKHRVFETSYRPKIEPVFPEEFHNKIKKLRGKQESVPNLYHIFGHRDEFIKTMESWNEKRIL